MLSDARGLPVTAASTEAVGLLDETVAAYCGLRADTGDCLKRALAADPNLVMGHILRGDFMMLFGKRAMVRRAEQGAAAARAAVAEVGASPRERLHLEALEAWIRGDLHGAVARWEAILLDHPRDIMALKLAYYGIFYLGDSEGVRDSVGRVLYTWDEGVPGYGFVLGCHAFGLEETGDYAAAERVGRRAVELNRADAWATHAVAHVLEMQGRHQDGIAWMDGLAGEWGGLNPFVGHLYWHRCLYHLELERYDRVLDIYDREIRPDSTDEYLDICNAAAMLWRLEQAGIDVGGRWAELAERSAEHTDDHILVFADLHYLMALAAAGDAAGRERWLQSSRRFAETGGEAESAVMQEVGLALGEAILAHRARQWGRVVEILLPLRYRIRTIGGSHAQRDLFAQMLIDAALKDGRLPLARALLSERLQQRPRNIWGWRQAARAAAQAGEGEALEAATAEARRLLC